MGIGKQKEFIDRVKLLINYSLNETYSENFKKINEQSTGQEFYYDRKFSDPEWAEKERKAREKNFKELEQKKRQEFADYQKNLNCASPERTVEPGPNKSGVSGPEGRPPGFCCYPAPFPCKATTPGEYARDLESTDKGFRSSVFLPPIGHRYKTEDGKIFTVTDVKVYFMDSVANWTDFVFTKFAGPKNSFTSEESEKNAIKEWRRMFPLGSVWYFDITEAEEEVVIPAFEKSTQTQFPLSPQTPESQGYSNYVTPFTPANKFVNQQTKRYTAWFTTEQGCGHSETGTFWRFDWYYSRAEKEYEGVKKEVQGDMYPQMLWVDNRTTWQKLVDDYAVKTAWALMPIFLFGGMLTEGATWLLWLEIISEGTLGLASAQRNFEKGQNIDGFFDLLFAALPLMKTTKFVGAVSYEDASKVLRSMNKAGITKQTPIDDVILWYHGADDDVKQIFSQMSKVGDEWSEARLLKKMESDVLSQIKAKPDLLKNINYSNIHVKEALTYLGLSGLGLLLNYTHGQTFNDVEKMRISALHANLEKFNKDLANQFLAKGLEQPEVLKANAGQEWFGVISDKKFMGEDPQEWQEKGETVVQQATTDSCSVGYPNTTLSASQIKKYEKQGWVNSTTMTSDDMSKIDYESVMKINCILYFKYKPDTLNKK